MAQLRKLHVPLQMKYNVCVFSSISHVPRSQGVKEGDRGRFSHESFDDQDARAWMVPPLPVVIVDAMCGAAWIAQDPTNRQANRCHRPAGDDLGCQISRREANMCHR